MNGQRLTQVTMVHYFITSKYRCQHFSAKTFISFTLYIYTGMHVAMINLHFSALLLVNHFVDVEKKQIVLIFLIVV